MRSTARKVSECRKHTLALALQTKLNQQFGALVHYQDSKRQGYLGNLSMNATENANGVLSGQEFGFITDKHETRNLKAMDTCCRTEELSVLQIFLVTGRETLRFPNT